MRLVNVALQTNDLLAFWDFVLDPSASVGVVERLVNNHRSPVIVDFHLFEIAISCDFEPNLADHMLVKFNRRFPAFARSVSALYLRALHSVRELKLESSERAIVTRVLVVNLVELDSLVESPIVFDHCLKWPLNVWNGLL